MTSKMGSQNGIFLMVLGVWGQRRPRMLPRSPPDTRQAQFFIKISLKAAQVCSSTAFSTVFFTSRIVLSMFFLNVLPKLSHDICGSRTALELLPKPCFPEVALSETSIQKRN